MENKFALVCVNEEKNVLSATGFASKDAASQQMTKEYSKHKAEVEDMVTDCCCASTDAYVEYGEEYGYYWQVVRLT